MKKVINNLGLVLFGISIIWVAFILFSVTKICIQTSSNQIGLILGAPLQPVILMTFSLIILYFSKIENFMNDPIFSKKWILVTGISFYLCAFCSMIFLYNIYYIPSRPPNILYSFASFVLFSTIIAFLIYIKKMIEIKPLRWVIWIFLILSFFFGLFVMFVYVFAQPDHNSRPGMAILVSLIGFSLIIFQIVQLKRIRS